MKIITTTADKFFNNENFKNDKLFVKAKGNQVIGFLKLSLKYLYINDENQSVESNIYCVLDFYVYNSYQRQGHGKSLFDKMLRFFNTYAYNIAYDNPTDTLLNFLFKHYSLSNYIKQNNNFIVYKEYFIVSFIINLRENIIVLKKLITILC